MEHRPLKQLFGSTFFSASAKKGGKTIIFTTATNGRRPPSSLISMPDSMIQ
jgi:hypothetical protein